MTATPHLMAKARQAHQSALLAAQNIFMAFSDHEEKYTSVTLGEFEVAAHRLEKAARLLLDAVAVHRGTQGGAE